MVMRSPYMATVTIGVPQQVYYLFARANFALRYTDFRTDCSHMMTKIWQNGSGCSLPKSPLITVYPSPRIISDPWILLGLYILRRAAEECKTREIRRPKLYEALDFLGQSLDQKWLVRRYRRGLNRRPAWLSGKRRTARNSTDCYSRNSTGMRCVLASPDERSRRPISR